MAAPTFQAVGTPQPGGAVQLTVPWPAHAIGDVALLFLESVSALGLATDAGFVRIADAPQAATGTVLDVYWCRATSTSMASPVTNTMSNHGYGVIVTYRGVIATGDPWDVTSGGVNNVAGTALSATGDTTTVAECLVVFAAAYNFDSASAQFSGEAAANLTSLAERHDAGTAIGNGGGIGVWDGERATAGAYGPLTATIANSTVVAFNSIALKPLAGGATVTPATVVTVTTVPTPTVLAASNVTPAVVATVVTVPTPTVSIPAAVTPATVAATTTVPTPTVTSGAVVAPVTVAAVTTVPTPTVTSEAVVTPATVATVTAVPTPDIAIEGDSTVAPATVDTTVTVPTPTVTAGAAVTPVTVAATTTVPTPTIGAGVTVTPAVVAVTTTVPTPQTTAGAVVTPAVVAATTTVPTPNVLAGTAVTPATVAATTTVPTPNVTTGALVTPATVAMTMTVPTPTIQAGPVVIIALPASGTIGDADNDGAIQDRNRRAVLTSGSRTGTIG